MDDDLIRSLVTRIDAIEARLDAADAEDVAAEAEAERIDAVCEEWRNDILRRLPLVTFPLAVERKG